ncbi:uncharacterized protein EV422DRAFT_45408 [Fimicolochytrium jonesii]|uniref:uncharacterized protein n=1 Tax=Fimicolochytrium jonesii TaxID=1396493 RepID=UPI0022FF3D83|nr:uncharacterized protein EV422DRAFT_45408 [Fimicolochytrium jonesii]KAI8821518.1 hypothetical protein EV422DRAFT_45408 [Fimicolochytrium jonesii]
MTFPGKHIPLIRFLGSRKLLQHHQPSSASSPSKTATANMPAGLNLAPQSAPPKRSGNTITYESFEQLPPRFRRLRTLSAREIEIIEAGGAGQILSL